MSQRARSAWVAGVVLSVAAAAAFVGSTLAVSAASSTLRVPAQATYPFARLSLNGGVTPDVPSRPSTFALSFGSSFTLNAASNGIVAPGTDWLDEVDIVQNVNYPVPAAGTTLVGPVALPFASDELQLTIVIKAGCFVFDSASSSYVFSGTPQDCVTASLSLQRQPYDVSSLVLSIGGSFRQVNPDTRAWAGSLVATFQDPGYTFPIVALGSAGWTELLIGDDGATRNTRKATFKG